MEHAFNEKQNKKPQKTASFKAQIAQQNRIKIKDKKTKNHKARKYIYITLIDFYYLGFWYC